MVFFGTKGSAIKSGNISNVTCPNCEEVTSMSFAIFVKYAHIYWIPTIPYKKVHVLECNHCDKTYKEKELPQAIKSKYELEKADSRIPVKYFSGIIILACLISWAFYQSSVHDKEELEYAEAPQVGDVYTIAGDQASYYTCMKVTELFSDNVIVVFNNYETNRMSDVHSIDIERNYSEVYDTIPKMEIARLHRIDEIKDIRRK